MKINWQVAGTVSVPSYIVVTLISIGCFFITIFVTISDEEITIPE